MRYFACKKDLTGSLLAPIPVHSILDLNSGMLMRRVMEAPVSLEPAR
jgi:hypothetical protein